MTEYFQTDDGLRLAYDDQGSGHPLLCLAGLTRNMADFEPVVERFADRARIIRLDSRGRGLSDHDPDFTNYNLVREAQDAVALLDHLGLDKASILGTSRGGLIAMGLAVGHPDRLTGVVLNDIGPVIEPDGMSQIMGYLGFRPGFRDYDEAADKLPEIMATQFRNASRSQWRDFARRVWTEAPDGLDLRYDAALRQAVLEHSATGDMPDLWPLFDALQPLPTALIRGANSNLLSRETADEMVRRQPDMIFADVPDRGHVPFLDEPEAVSAIETYLERAT
ncbi:alpha/beta fold hydrolase [Tropicimonas sediminicola]|uniref:Pimeloyl-ACP methyl ester carboxylesterase n=1 Tax=Tropicimonas sediminicola TaxID=1031541 RepID=A0A239CQD2_9RHOB|nr:alpha/beta hydrolase [Tropicimonas sediminicola]SNS22375.1 Pimeloyl-ACP methyl ester carboxylesterase [Tropicimonas sediminicola]